MDEGLQPRDLTLVTLRQSLVVESVLRLRLKPSQTAHRVAGHNKPTLSVPGCRIHAEFTARLFHPNHLVVVGVLSSGEG
jgi:hypothetical protein